MTVIIKERLEPLSYRQIKISYDAGCIFKSIQTGTHFILVEDASDGFKFLVNMDSWKRVSDHCGATFQLVFSKETYNMIVEPKM